MKTMAKIAILLFASLMVLLAFGCKSTKQTVDTSTKTETNIQNDVKQSGSVDATVKQSESNTDKSVEQSASVEESNTIKWSTPDSTGQQYPIETTNTKKTTGRVNQNDLSTKKGTDLDLSASGKSEDKSKLDNKARDDTEATLTETDETHKWTIWGIVTGVLVAGVLAYLVLRRYRQV